jgi:hypothetical protein
MTVLASYHRRACRHTPYRMSFKGEGRGSMEMRAMMPTATESVWWPGALFTIKGRRETTGGALGLIEADFWGRDGHPPCTSTTTRTRRSTSSTGRSASGGAMRFHRQTGEFVFGPREVPHCYKVLDGGARALVLITPAGLEHMSLTQGCRWSTRPSRRRATTTSTM